MLILMLLGSAALSMGLAAIAYTEARSLTLGQRVNMRWELGPHYVAFGIAVLVIYFPLFSWLSDRLNNKRPQLLFALVGALLGLAPAYGLHLWGEPHLAALLSVEAYLSYGLFGIAGGLFGLCYVELSRDRSLLL